MTTTPSRPVPRPSAISEPYWTACARHEFIVQRCRACARYVFAPQKFCRYCLADELEWVPASGRATLYSYTIIWRPQTPAFEVPYTAGVIELEEGYFMLSNVVECAPEDVHVGMPLEVTWLDLEGGTLPVFRPRKT